MISFDHAARQIGGAWKMAFNAEDWKSTLDRGLDDVFASLSALAFASPLVVLASVAGRRAASRIPEFSDSIYVSAPLAALIVSDLATFALDWAASLALLLALARLTGAGRHAADLIVGYNWIQPVIAAAQLPAIALMAAAASRTLGGIVGLPAFALSLALLWGIVRRGLNAAPAPAAAIVVLLIFVGIAADLLCSAALKAALAVQG